MLNLTELFVTAGGLPTMLNLTELFLTLCSWLIWLTPFTFVFFLAHTVREVVRGGEKDVTYGALAGLSLFMLVVGALGILL